MILIKALTGAAAIWSASAAAQADTFAERWPMPVAVDPVVAQAEPVIPARVRRARNEHRCHRIYFTENNHRYWRCKR